ncbi:translocase of chloroplast 159, chloroplastic isoform X2 [Andrographis paniculata]|nr:translocase of chloroplast 159, chloroplastic isoform X2 [Andrographis paniculata]
MAVTDEEVSVSKPTPIVDIKPSLVEKFRIPIAKISVDSDDDSKNSLASENDGSDDDGLSGVVVRVPSIEALLRVNSISTPKARPSADAEFVEEIENSDYDLKSKDEMEHVIVDDEPIDAVISSDTIEVEEATPHSTIMEEEENSKVETEDKEIREIDVIDDVKECADLIYRKAEQGCSLCVTVEPEVTELRCSSSNFGSPSEDGEHNSTFDGEKTEILDKDVIFYQREFANSIDQRESISFTGTADLTELEVTESGASMDDADEKGSNIVLDDRITCDPENVRKQDVGSVVEVSSETCPEISKLSTGPIAMLDDQIVGYSKEEICGKLEETLSEAEKKKLEKIQHIRAKYLWLLRQLRCSSDDSVASDVLHQLRFAEGTIASQESHLDSTEKSIAELEISNEDDSDCSMCILVLGKTGVGKSSTINSIFGETKTAVDAFEPATGHVKEIFGTKDGVKLKIIDTPGLRSSLKDESANRKVLFSIKRLMQKSQSDVILLYVDRLDSQASAVNDLPILKLISACLGSSIWQKSILVLTHADSIPPDGSDGAFADQQLFFARQLIGRSVGEFLSMAHDYIIPACLVENRRFAEKIEHCKREENWTSQLLLLCYSMKTLSDLSSVAAIRSPVGIGKKSTKLSCDKRTTYFREYRYLASLLKKKQINDKTTALSTVDCHFGESSSRRGETDMSIALTDENEVMGIKLGDEIRVGDRVTVTGNAGIVDATCGANVELCWVDENYLASSRRASLGLSAVKYRGDLICGCDVQSDFAVGGTSKMTIEASLDSRFHGKISMKTRCVDQVEVAVMFLFSIAKTVFGKVCSPSSRRSSP